MAFDVLDPDGTLIFTAPHIEEALPIMRRRRGRVTVRARDGELMGRAASTRRPARIAPTLPELSGVA